jgi:CRP-like cAMP-binding protein
VGDVVYRPRARLAHVYFPTDGVVSLRVVMADGRGAEVGTVGNEGVVGAAAALAGGATGNREAIVQLAGHALRMSADAFADAATRPGPLRELVARYAQAFDDQVAQSAACNALHPVEQRAARWLLMTHDRVGRDAFGLTQEFLAQMLGARRPTVSAAAGQLKRAGLIRYRRGRVEVLDRAGLEAAACECYAAIAEAYRHHLGTGPGPSSDRPPPTGGRGQGRRASKATAAQPARGAPGAVARPAAGGSHDLRAAGDADQVRACPPGTHPPPRAQPRLDPSAPPGTAWTRRSWRTGACSCC